VLAVSPRQSNPKLTVPRSSTGDSITSVKSPRSSKNLDPDQVNAINFNVIISNCRCRNLKAMDSNGLSDPFITFNFDGVEFETEIKEKTLNPVFDFRKEFKYTLRAKEIDIMHKKLVKITVTDYDRTSRNDVIDTVTLNLEQLATGPIHHCHTLT
jgi:Ca2+-dependent lipid-binding protein